LVTVFSLSLSLSLCPSLSFSLPVLWQPFCALAVAAAVPSSSSELPVPELDSFTFSTPTAEAEPAPLSVVPVAGFAGKWVASGVPEGFSEYLQQTGVAFLERQMAMAYVSTTTQYMIIELDEHSMRVSLNPNPWVGELPPLKADVGTYSGEDPDGEAVELSATFVSATEHASEMKYVDEDLVHKSTRTIRRLEQNGTRLVVETVTLFGDAPGTTMTRTYNRSS